MENTQSTGLDIDVVRLKTGIEMAEALIGGSIDVGIVVGAPLTSTLLRTDKLLVIGSAWTTDGGYAKVLVSKDSPYQSIRDLKGKKIANNIGSDSYRALGDWCAKNDCSVDDFQILDTAPAAIIAALEAGSVEAGIWFAPTTLIAVRKGVARILGDFKGANLGQATWTARKAYAEEHPDVSKFRCGVFIRKYRTFCRRLHRAFPQAFGFVVVRTMQERHGAACRQRGRVA